MGTLAAQVTRPHTHTLARPQEHGRTWARRRRFRPLMVDVERAGRSYVCRSVTAIECSVRRQRERGEHRIQRDKSALLSFVGVRSSTRHRHQNFTSTAAVGRPVYIELELTKKGGHGLTGGSVREGSWSCDLGRHDGNTWCAVCALPLYMLRVRDKARYTEYCAAACSVFHGGWRTRGMLHGCCH